MYAAQLPLNNAGKESLQVQLEMQYLHCWFFIHLDSPLARSDACSLSTCMPHWTGESRVMHVQTVLQCRQAKLDALTALSAAAGGYGPPGLHPHLSTVWLALRAELLAPAAPALLPADLASAQQVCPVACCCCCLIQSFMFAAEAHASA